MVSDMMIAANNMITDEVGISVKGAGSSEQCGDVRKHFGVIITSNSTERVPEYKYLRFDKIHGNGPQRGGSAPGSGSTPAFTRLTPAPESSHRGRWTFFNVSRFVSPKEPVLTKWR
jgi:hypothetical protein